MSSTESEIYMTKTECNDFSCGHCTSLVSLRITNRMAKITLMSITVSFDIVDELEP